MKKRIFLITLMVALFVCLFALSASAADMFESEYTDEVTKFYDTDGITELKPSWSNLADQNATAVIVKADGTAIRIPLYYIYYYNGTTFYDDERADSSGSAGFKFTWISEILEETISRSNLVALDIPEGITKVNTINNCKALEEVVFPLSATGFPKCENHPTLKKVFAKQARNDDGTISGITSVASYSFKNVYALEYFGMQLNYLTFIGDNAFLNCAITEINFEGPFTGINTAAFSSCKSLKTVRLINTSSGIISCGKQTFANCTALTSVVMDKFSIGEYAFEKINTTTSTLNFVATNVGTVGTQAFSASTALANVDISGPITKLGDNVFSGCSGLLTARIYNENTTAASCGSGVFSERTSLTSIEFHNVDIPWRGFYKLKLSPENMKITGNYTKIGEEAFFECSNLTAFTIPDTVSSIGAKAFYKTGISTVTIPGSVSSIGQRAFQYCPNLESVYFEASHAGVELSSVGSNVFGTDNSGYKNTALKKVVFDKDCNITTFGTYMFYNCDNLEFLSMPDSVTTLGSSTNGQIFWSCDNLGPVYLSKGLEAENIYWSNLFVDCKNMYFVNEFFTDKTQVTKPTVYYFPNIISSISVEIFKNCLNLNDVLVFGDNLTSLTKDYAFGRKGASADLGTKSIVFLGDMTTLVYGGEGAYTNYYVAGKNTTVASSSSGTCNVYVCKEEGAPHLVELRGLSQDANCTENQMVYDACFCGAKLNVAEVDGTALGHNHDIMNATAIVYADYTKDGVFTAVCLRCNENVTETVEGSHLFTYSGVSMSSDGTGLCAGYIFNKEYIAVYQNLKGDAFKYGAIATLVMGENKSPLSDGYESNVINVPLFELVSDLSAVDIVVRGNYTDVAPENVENYNVYNLAMSLYVIDGEETYYVWDSKETVTANNTVVTTTPIYVPKN